MCRNEKRMRRCCFTGHRPEKMMGGMAHIQMKLQFENTRFHLQVRETFSELKIPKRRLANAKFSI